MSFGENRFFQANKNKSKSLSLSDNDDDDDYDEDLLPDIRSRFFRQQAMAADHLSMRLLQVDTEEEEEEILRESLNLSRTSTASDGTPNSITTSIKQKKEFETKAQTSFFALLAIAFVAFILVTALLLLGIQFVGPPNQPVGPYRLLERQVRGMILLVLLFWLCAYRTLHHNSTSLYLSHHHIIIIRKETSFLTFTIFMKVEIQWDPMASTHMYPKNELWSWRLLMLPWKRTFLMP